MNIVFWFLVALAIVAVWFLLSFAFRGIGSIGMNIFNNAKREIEGEEPDENKEKEGKENEEG